MKDSLTRHNSRDFRQRYEGTYGFYHTMSGLKLLVYVSSVTERQATFRDLQGKEYFTYADSGETFEFIPVNRGYYNGVKDTYFLARVPARQWQRGISSGNTMGSVFYKGALCASDLNFEFLYKALVETTTNTEAWAQYLNKQREAIALSRHFAITRNQFYFYHNPVGQIEGTKIILKTPSIQQEVNDVVRRNKFNFTVEVEHTNG